MKEKNELEKLLENRTNMLDSSAIYNSRCGSTAYTTAYTTSSYSMPDVSYRIESILKDLFDMSRNTKNVTVPICKTVSESTARLETALDTMPDCEHDCKICKYYIPGGVEKCNNSKRIADFLIDNNIVLVTRPKD